MLKSTILLLLILTAAACSNPSSGGGGGLGGNNPQGQTPVGVCIEGTQDGLGQICTEYYSGAKALSAREIEEACQTANIGYGKVCPPGKPLVSCEVKMTDYTAIYRVTAPEDQKPTWLTRCQQLGGRTL